MTEVEALLSADAGRPPPGSVVFRLRDTEAPTRRARIIAALSIGAIAVGCFVLGADLDVVAVIALLAALLGVLGTPTERDPEEPVRVKQPTLLVTTSGLIVRDDGGLRSWQFQDLADVRPYLDDRRVGLVIVCRDGSRHFVDNLAFERGEELGEILGRHLRPSRA
jgi:hypothetical protein